MGRNNRFDELIAFPSIGAFMRCGWLRCLVSTSGGLLLACSPVAVGGKDTVAQAEDGVEAPTCAGCPEFVAVLTPLDGLRPIVAVAKYELTWSDYLAAVDDGACTVPNPNRPPFFRSAPDDLNPNLEWFRIDWPITILDPVEVDCYLDWLSDRAGARAAIPPRQEWRWFASAGRPDVRYPWGDDPAAGSEMLAGKIDYDAVRVPWPGRPEARVVHKYLVALKVGQGDPNPWGLHDLLGNALELTSTMKPPGENTSERPSAMLAGTSHSDRKWADEGLDADFSTVIWDGQYAASPAIRVVLIGEMAVRDIFASIPSSREM